MHIASATGSNIVQSEAIASAMKKIDRADFVIMKARAYEDSPQPIGKWRSHKV